MIGQSKQLPLRLAGIGREGYEIDHEFRTRADGVLRSLRKHRGLVVELMWEFPELLGFLEKELKSGRIHYFHACIELSNALEMSKLELFNFVQAVMYECRRDVIRRFSGQDYPTRAIRLLYRLRSPVPLQAREYYVLLEASKNRYASKALNHQTDIYFAPIYFWNSLPSQIQSPRLLSILLKEPRSLRRVSGLISGLLSAPSEEVLARFGQSLASAKTSQQLISGCQEWRRKFRELDRFPAPPLPGSKKLMPILNAYALRVEGRVMRLPHLAHPMPEIRQGTAYYYHWDNDNAATVELRRRENNIWQLENSFRKGGAPLSGEEDKYISNLISEQQSKSVFLST